MKRKAKTHKVKKYTQPAALALVRREAAAVAETNFKLREEIAALKDRVKTLQELSDQQRTTISNLRGDQYKRYVQSWIARLDDIADALLTKIENEQRDAAKADTDWSA